MAVTESDPVFDHCRQIHDIGLPALIKEDGTIFLDWEIYLKEKGYSILKEELKQSCSLDRKGC